MGIDAYKQTRVKSRVGRKLTSTNLYQKLLIKLYTFLTRRSDSVFNKTILRRLGQSRVNRYPISISRVAKFFTARKDNKGLTVVVVATVTDDVRMVVLPQMTVCALRFTETARKRIIAAGGKVMTFDQLAQKNPTGSNTLLLRGPKVREELKHFGRAPGLPGSHTKPYVRSNGRKFERGAQR